MKAHEAFVDLLLQVQERDAQIRALQERIDLMTKTSLEGLYEGRHRNASRAKAIATLKQVREIGKADCCLGLSPQECAKVPSRHCDGSAEDGR
jgi:hypothetical protein